MNIFKRAAKKVSAGVKTVSGLRAVETITYKAKHSTSYRKKFQRHVKIAAAVGTFFIPGVGAAAASAGKLAGTAVIGALTNKLVNNGHRPGAGPGDPGGPNAPPKYDPSTDPAFDPNAPGNPGGGNQPYNPANDPNNQATDAGMSGTTKLMLTVAAVGLAAFAMSAGG